MWPFISLRAKGTYQKCELLHGVFVQRLYDSAIHRFVQSLYNDNTIGVMALMEMTFFRISEIVFEKELPYY